jgi:hypothetical protein
VLGGPEALHQPVRVADVDVHPVVADGGDDALLDRRPHGQHREAWAEHQRLGRVGHAASSRRPVALMMRRRRAPVDGFRGAPTEGTPLATGPDVGP